MPDVSSAGLDLSRPEATFTRMAAGLCAVDPPPPQLDMQTLLSILAVGMHQASQTPQQLPDWEEFHGPATHQPRSHHKGDTDSLTDSDQGEDCPEVLEFSDNEGLAPDVPAFIGLFRPALFKSLLHKARLTTNLGTVGEQPSTSKSATGPL